VNTNSKIWVGIILGFGRIQNKIARKNIMENSSHPTKKGWRFWLPIVCFVIGLFSIFSGLAGCNDHITVHLPGRGMTVTVPVEPTEADKDDSFWGGIIWCGVSFMRLEN